MGKLYGIGVGPGDPELITMKANRILKECECIGIPAESQEKCTAYDIAKLAVPEIEGKAIIAVPIPMTTDQTKLEEAYDMGCKKIAICLEQGLNVAFLNLGDPTLYGTYMRIHEGITKLGYDAEIINGITSFTAVAAKLSMPLGMQEGSVHILPGYYRRDEIKELVLSYIEKKDTVVIMKPSKAVGEIKELLIELENEKIITAGAVTDCGMKTEYVTRDIRNLKENAGYFTTIIVNSI